MKYYSIPALARALSMTSSAVRYRVLRYGLGVEIAGRIVLTAKDADKLRAILAQELEGSERCTR
jgi:hypothetical protein